MHDCGGSRNMGANPEAPRPGHMGLAISEFSKSVLQLVIYHFTVPELTLNSPLNSQNSRPCHISGPSWPLIVRGSTVSDVEGSCSKSLDLVRGQWDATGAQGLADGSNGLATSASRPPWELPSISRIGP